MINTKELTQAIVEENKSMDNKIIEDAMRTILKELGEDIEREGLLDTPKRVAKMYREVFQGIGIAPETALTTTFAEDYEGIVTVKDITFYTFCEHHIIPFFGKAHIGYIPNGRVVGLSKFARLVELSSQRPQVQERMTTQIANAIENVLQPKGVIVTLEAEHLCMCARGVKKPGTKTVTTIKKGLFASDVSLCEEFERSISRD
ncbi:GTP cyclohydrolase 1 [Lysinibacillus sp. PLM2]|nr:GTP cyclohydrolase 1 [Lysinibacillus sp. PLM2]